MDEPLIQVTSAGVLTFLHANHQGSIIAKTSATGTVSNKYKYGLFGETASLSGTTFGFNGQRFDSESSLYYYKRRFYSPAIGRFLQPDPIGYDLKTSENCACSCTISCSGADPSQLNLYMYVNNDPLNMIDTRQFIITPMVKPKISIKTFLLCSLLCACIGFFIGGGWRMFFDYSQWHYEISMHANDVEETLAFINWCCSGPADITNLFGIQD